MTRLRRWVREVWFDRPEKVAIALRTMDITTGAAKFYPGLKFDPEGRRSGPRVRYPPIHPSTQESSNARSVQHFRHFLRLTDAR